VPDKTKGKYPKVQKTERKYLRKIIWLASLQVYGLLGLVGLG